MLDLRHLREIFFTFDSIGHVFLALLFVLGGGDVCLVNKLGSEIEINLGSY